MTVIAFPSPHSRVDAEWQRYVELCQAAAADPALLTDPEHQMETARAWSRWRDLFLANERRASC